MNCYNFLLCFCLFSPCGSCVPESWADDGMILDAVNHRAYREEWQTSNVSQCAFLPPPVHRVVQEAPIAETTQRYWRKPGLLHGNAQKWK